MLICRNIVLFVMVKVRDFDALFLKSVNCVLVMERELIFVYIRTAPNDLRFWLFMHFKKVSRHNGQDPHNSLRKSISLQTSIRTISVIFYVVIIHFGRVKKRKKKFAKGRIRTHSPLAKKGTRYFTQYTTEELMQNQQNLYSINII